MFLQCQKFGAALQKEPPLLLDMFRKMLRSANDRVKETALVTVGRIGRYVIKVFMHVIRIEYNTGLLCRQ